MKAAGSLAPATPLAADGESRVPEKTMPGHLVSLDAYRGLIMLLLISDGFGLASLRKHSGWAWIAYQMDHSPWTGCTLWDLIQPASRSWLALRCRSHSPEESKEARHLRTY